MNAPKHVLREVDERIALNAFFHGSPDPLPVGKVLRARKNKWRAASPAEVLLERVRPHGVPSRSKTWYMVEDPCAVESAGGQTDHLYEVEPIAAPRPVNFAHAQPLFDKVFSDVFGKRKDPDNVVLSGPKYVKAAKAYWSNKPSDTEQTEWLSPAIKVVREVKCKKRVRRKKSAKRRGRR